MPRGGKRQGAGAHKKEIKRDTAITIRITNDLRDLIKLKAQALGKSQTQFLIDCIEEKLS